MSIYPSGSLIGGRFQVAGRPLKGGQGIVYLCIDRQEQRPVALKTFRPELLPSRAARDRFLREGTHWVDLGAHPHIVRCYRVVRVGDGAEVYLALELVAKEQGRADASLRSWLLPGQPLPAETALLFALQAARGMLHAVTTIPGFVHRDLKPENLLVGADRLSADSAAKGQWVARILRRRPARPVGSAANRLRVTDFGLVRVLDNAEAVSMSDEEEPLPARPGLTRMGRILGTPPYVAPEQWDSPNVDLRADVYALGCILGEMLIGRLLVQGGTPQGFRQAHQGGHASEIARNLPGCLAGVLGRCLAVDSAARYGSWGEVRAELEAAYEAVTGWEAPDLEPETALGWAERVVAGWSYSVIGSSYVELGEPQTALRYFERARVVGAAEDYRPLEAAGLACLGAAYDDLGDAHRAIGYHEQALAISREIGNRREVGLALGNLGAAYVQLGDTGRAIEHFEQSLAIAREIDNQHDEGMAAGNLGATYHRLGDVHRAIGYYKESLAIAREIGDRRGEGSALGNLGSAHTDLGNSRRAIGYCEESLAIARCTSWGTPMSSRVMPAVPSVTMSGRWRSPARSAPEICSRKLWTAWGRPTTSRVMPAPLSATTSRRWRSPARPVTGAEKRMPWAAWRTATCTWGMRGRPSSTGSRPNLSWRRSAMC
jgi:serine/threonine protein kinase